MLLVIQIKVQTKSMINLIKSYEIIIIIYLALLPDQNSKKSNLKKLSQIPVKAKNLMNHQQL